MTTRLSIRLAGLIIVLSAALAMSLLVGCGKKTDAPTAQKITALGSFDTARSALSTTAPDAKLLVVQTVQATLPTATPDWVYLFGSPSTGKTYAVYIAGGKSLGAQEYGSAALTDSEWAAVPGTEKWKVDSDTAYTKALEASGAEGPPAAYIMGMITYKPAEDTSTVNPFVWNVQFDPGTSGASTSTIEVDAATGKTAVAK